MTDVKSQANARPIPALHQAQAGDHVHPLDVGVHDVVVGGGRVTVAVEPIGQGGAGTAGTRDQDAGSGDGNTERYQVEPMAESQRGILGAVAEWGGSQLDLGVAVVETSGPERGDDRD